jgi:hypothetical protein
MSGPGVAPEAWSAASAGPAPRDLARLLPAAPGVYRFSDAAGRVLYLGRSAWVGASPRTGVSSATEAT